MTEKVCKICGATGVSLLYASHKDLGTIGVCQHCWQNKWQENTFLSGTTCNSSSCGTSCCSGCSK